MGLKNQICNLCEISIRLNVKLNFQFTIGLISFVDVCLFIQASNTLFSSFDLSLIHNNFLKQITTTEIMVIVHLKIFVFHSSKISNYFV